MIRLTLILIAGIFSTMLIFGTESEEAAAARIEAEVLPPVEDVVTLQPVESAQTTPVLETATVAPEQAAPVTETSTDTSTAGAIAAALAEAGAEPIIDVTKAAGIDLTSLPSGTSETNASPEEAEVVTAPVVEPEPVVEPAKILVVTGTRVNMRAGPSTARDVIGRLRRGDKAELVAEVQGGWMQIRVLATGDIGFMSGDFLAPDPS